MDLPSGDSSAQPQNNPGRARARILLALLGVALAAGMFVPFHGARAAGISLVQTASTTNASLPVNPTATGNLLVIAVNVGGPGLLTGITDDADDGSNMYVNAGVDAYAGPGNPNGTTTIWYVKNSKGRVRNITPAGSYTTVAYTFWEFSGVDTSSPLDATSTLQNQSASLTPLGPSITTTKPGELVISAVIVANNVTHIHAGNAFTNDALPFGDGFAHLIATSTGTFNAQWDQNPTGIYASNAASFKPAVVMGVQVSSRSDTLSNSQPSATSNHTVAFTVNSSIYGSSISGSSTLTLTFPAGFAVPGSLDCGDVDVATSSQFNFNWPSCQPTATAWGMSVSGTSLLIFTAPTDSAVHVATGTPITIKIGSNATFQQQGVHWLTNPSAGGTYTVSLGGTFGGSGTMLVQVGVKVGVVQVPGQNTGETGSGGALSNLAFPGNVTAGNQIVVVVQGYNANATTPTVSTPTQASGTATIGAMSQDGAYSNGNGSNTYTLKIFRATVTGSGSLTLAFPGTFQFGLAALNEYSGMDANPVDGSPATNTGTGATESSGNVQTSAAGMVLMTSAELSNTNFTYALSDTNIYSNSQGQTSYTGEAQHKKTTGAGTYTLTAGTANSWFWSSLAVAYKAAVSSYQPAVTVQATVAESLAFTVSPSVTSVSFVQTNSRDSGSASTSNVLAFGSGNAAGNLIIVAVEWDTATSATSSVTDSNGNAYASAIGPVSTLTGFYEQLWYAKNIAGGANTVTARLTGRSGTVFGLYLHEYHGADATSPLDATSVATGASGSSMDSGSQTTNYANELVFGYGAAGSFSAPGTGFTSRNTLNANMTEDKQAVGTGSYHATATNGVPGQAWLMMMATFKGAPTCTADDGATVNQILTTSATAVPFGIINPNAFYQGCQDLTVSTNAGDGYSVTVQESHAMMTADGRFTIPDTACDAGDCSVATATAWATPTHNGFGHTCANQSGSDCNPTYGGGTKFKPVPSIPIGTAPGQIGFVQENQSTPDGCGSCSATTISFTANNTAGNLIVVALDYDDAVGLTSVTDTKGNVYVRAGTEVHQGVGHWFADVYYAKNIASGANSVTVKLSGAASFMEVYIHEYSGLDTALPLDATASAIGNSGSDDSGPATTNFANELVFGFGTSSLTAGPGFTARSAGLSDQSITEDRIVSAIGTYDATASFNGSNWSMLMATFRASNTPVSLMSNTGAVTNSTGRVKYRLSVPSSQAAGMYTTVITYTILGTF